MKPKLNKFMSFTPENLEMIGTKIQKNHKKEQLIGLKRDAFHKMRSRKKASKFASCPKIVYNVRKISMGGKTMQESNNSSNSNDKTEFDFKNVQTLIKCPEDARRAVLSSYANDPENLVLFIEFLIQDKKIEKCDDVYKGSHELLTNKEKYNHFRAQKNAIVNALLKAFNKHFPYQSVSKSVSTSTSSTSTKKQCALDKTFETHKEKILAVIEEIQNETLPPHRYGELIHLNDTNGHEGHHKTFVYYAIQKLEVFKLSDLFYTLQNIMGDDLVHSYLNLKNKLDKDFDIFEIFLEDHGDSNRAEREAISAEKKEFLEGLQNEIKQRRAEKNANNGQQHQVVNGGVNTHNAAANVSAQRSFIRLLKEVHENNADALNGLNPQYKNDNGYGPEKVGFVDTEGYENLVHEHFEIFGNTLKSITSDDDALSNAYELYKQNLNFFPEYLFSVWENTNEEQKLEVLKSVEAEEIDTEKYNTKESLTDELKTKLIELEKKKKYSDLTQDRKEEIKLELEYFMFQAKKAKEYLDALKNQHRVGPQYSYFTNNRDGYNSPSGLSIEDKLFLVIWAAFKDKENFVHKGEYSEGENINRNCVSLIHWVYDAMRGYQVDNGECANNFKTAQSQNNNRCANGATKSLASALNGLHKKVEVVVVTAKTFENWYLAKCAEAVSELQDELIADSLEDLQLKTDLKNWVLFGEVSDVLRVIIESKALSGDNEEEFKKSYQQYLNERQINDSKSQVYSKLKATKNIIKYVNSERTVENVYKEIQDGDLPLLVKTESGFESTVEHLNGPKFDGNLAGKLIEKAKVGLAQQALTARAMVARAHQVDVYSFVVKSLPVGKADEVLKYKWELLSFTPEDLRGLNERDISHILHERQNILDNSNAFKNFKTIVSLLLTKPGFVSRKDLCNKAFLLNCAESSLLKPFELAKQWGVDVSKVLPDFEALCNEVSPSFIKKLIDLELVKITPATVKHILNCNGSEEGTLDLVKFVVEHKTAPEKFDEVLKDELQRNRPEVFEFLLNCNKLNTYKITNSYPLSNEILHYLEFQAELAGKKELVNVIKSHKFYNDIGILPNSSEIKETFQLFSTGKCDHCFHRFFYNYRFENVEIFNALISNLSIRDKQKLLNANNKSSICNFLINYVKDVCEEEKGNEKALDNGLTFNDLKILSDHLSFCSSNDHFWNLISGDYKNLFYYTFSPEFILRFLEVSDQVPVDTLMEIFVRVSLNCRDAKQKNEIIKILNSKFNFDKKTKNQDNQNVFEYLKNTGRDSTNAILEIIGDDYKCLASEESEGEILFNVIFQRLLDVNIDKGEITKTNELFQKLKADPNYKSNFADKTAIEFSKGSLAYSCLKFGDIESITPEFIKEIQLMWELCNKFETTKISDSQYPYAKKLILNYIGQELSGVFVRTTLHNAINKQDSEFLNKFFKSQDNEYKFSIPLILTDAIYKQDSEFLNRFAALEGKVEGSSNKQFIKDALKRYIDVNSCHINTVNSFFIGSELNEYLSDDSRLAIYDLYLSQTFGSNSEKYKEFVCYKKLIRDRAVKDPCTNLELVSTKENTLSHKNSYSDLWKNDPFYKGCEKPSEAIQRHYKRSIQNDNSSYFSRKDENFGHELDKYFEKTFLFLNLGKPELNIETKHGYTGLTVEYSGLIKPRHICYAATALATCATGLLAYNNKDFIKSAVSSFVLNPIYNAGGKFCSLFATSFNPINAVPGEYLPRLVWWQEKLKSTTGINISIEAIHTVRSISVVSFLCGLMLSPLAFIANEGSRNR